MLSPRSEWEEFLEQLRTKTLVFTALVTLAFAVIVLRLWQLQIVEYATLAGRAESNRIRQVTLDGRRGKIFDRNGIPLVDSRPSFQLSVIPEDTAFPERTLKRLRERFDFDIGATLEKMRAVRPFDPVVIHRDISRQEVAFVEENRLDLPGAHLDVKAIRNYIHGGMAAHLFGYLGAITPEQYARAPAAVYSRDDFVGKFGIEKVYEETLRGTKGFKRIGVDAAGRELALLGKIQPKSGGDLQLTIDYDTQMAAERAFEDKMGAAMAIDPDTGDVLAMVSKPSFNPNVFAHGVTAKNWESLVGDEFHPLQNRVIQGQYPPGSTFKIIMAAAGLEEGIITEDSTFFCPGHYRLGRRSYRCWKKGGHGAMNVRQALIQSCDVFFYNVGRKLGIDTIAEYARKFGLGQRTNLGLGAEKKGLIPTTQWKLKARKEKWIAGETISCSIGQGYMLVTVAQQARMIAAVANGGTLVTPTLIRDANTAGGRARAPVSKKTLDLIRGALRGVVAAPHGTGWRLRNGPYAYAGKTGTSQVVRMKKDEPEDIEDIALRFRDHGWFVAYAPSGDPKIAVAVIAEHAGHGGEAAAPIAQKIIDAYLDKYYPGLRRQAQPEPVAARSGETAG